MNLVEENFTTERCVHVSNRVFVLDKNKQPLMPCTPARARVLLSAGKAAVFRWPPFTIILTYREGGDIQGLTLKIDPGSPSPPRAWESLACPETNAQTAKGNPSAALPVAPARFKPA